MQLALDTDPATGRLTPHLTLVADVRNLQGRWRTPATGEHPYFVERGQLRYADDTVELVGVQGRVGALPVQLDGTLTHLAHPTLAVQVTVKEAPTDALTRLIPSMRNLPFTLTGRFTGWAQVVGPLASPANPRACQRAVVAIQLRRVDPPGWRPGAGHALPAGEQPDRAGGSAAR